MLIVPKRNAIHSVSLSWVVPYLYLTYCHSTSYSNEWVSSTLTNIRHMALVGGLSLG